MSFALYVLGYLIIAFGVGLGGHYLHVPAHWIAVAVLIILGMAVASGVSKTRHKDPS